MIYIKSNQVNPIILPLSDILGRCSEFIIKLVNETSKKAIFISNSNMSNFISTYDLIEVKDSSTASFKEFYFDEDVRLPLGQYTAYIYSADEVPTTKEEVLDITNNTDNLCQITKSVVSTDIQSTNGVASDGIKLKYK